MTKQQNQIIITSILVVVLVITVILNLPKKEKPSPPAQPQQPPSTPQPRVPVAPRRPTTPIRPPATAEDAVASLEELEAQKKRAQLDWGMDPFYHPIKKEIYKGAGLELKGISIVKGKEGYVFINDEILTIGDVIAGYRVEEIQKNKVLLRKSNESFYLILHEE